MKIGDRLSAAWPITKAHLVPFAIALVVAILVGIVAAVTVIGTFVIFGPITCGMFSMCLKAARGQKPELGDLFSKFNGDTIIYGLIAMAPSLTGIGSLVTPGLLWGLWFMADKPMPWKDALNRNIEMLKKDWVTTLVFPFLIYLIGSLGSIACCIGIFVTYPLSLIAWALEYNETYAKGGSATPA